MSVIPNSVDNIFTFVLTNGTFNIIAEYGVMAVAMKLTAGTATFIGSLKLGSQSSTAIPLAVNDPITISQNQAIDVLTIDATAGTVQIICRRA
mgnify:CR=1 FL=1